jgi:hypothetical protein
MRFESRKRFALKLTASAMLEMALTCGAAVSWAADDGTSPELQNEVNE